MHPRRNDLNSDRSGFLSSSEVASSKVGAGAKVVSALAVGLVLLLAACAGDNLPTTESGAIAYVKSKLHPPKHDREFTGLSSAEHSKIVERCRSFLKYATWSAYQIGRDRWSVTGRVHSSPPSRFIYDRDALGEYLKGVGESIWRITEDGNLILVNLSPCSHR